MCEFHCFLRYFSSAICLCPFLCLLKASTFLLQVSADRGGVRLPGCWTEAGRHRWRTKPSSLLSPTDFFNEGKPDLLFKATACWHYLFMFKSQEPLRRAQSETRFLPQTVTKKKTSWVRPRTCHFLCWENLFELKRKCLQLEIIKRSFPSVWLQWYAAFSHGWTHMITCQQDQDVLLRTDSTYGHWRHSSIF